MVVPKIYLVPLILIAGLVGSYNVAYSMTDVWVSLIAGTIAYLAIKADYPLTPMVIAIILGPMVEYNLRVALTMSQGSFYPFIQKPVSLGFLILTVLSMIIFYWSKKRGKGKITL
jgi:putative tricarboxylic transport membrane protein